MTLRALTGADRLVVVGASLAGLRAAESARRAGFDGALTLIGAEPHLPYDRPPLSKALLEEGTPATPTYFRDESQLVEGLGVDLLLGHRATALDPVRRVVTVDGPDGPRAVPYDALVVATGATARSLPGGAAGGDLAGVHTLRTLDDALAVRAALDAGARTVVVGAGFIGSEVASAVRRRGGGVTIVEAAPAPLERAVGPAVGAGLTALHEAHGTTLRCGSAVARLESDDVGHVRAVVLEDGTRLPADLVVVGIGARPATDWLAGSGIALDPRDGGVVCDATLATSLPGVWAAGDVAHWPNPVLGQAQRLEHWTSAAEQGAAAARNAVDPGAATPYGTVPYFWSDWYGARLQLVGSPVADELRVVDGSLDGPPAGEPGARRWVALYRRGDRIVGACTWEGRAEVMKYRALVARGASWSEALELAASRAAARSARTARPLRRNSTYGASL